jgi:hypothetical protein
MQSNKLISAKLDYLYKERESVEASGYRIDPDLRKIYRFISEEIQELQLIIFAEEYQGFGDRLEEIFNVGLAFPLKEKDNVIP